MSASTKTDARAHAKPARTAVAKGARPGTRKLRARVAPASEPGVDVRAPLKPSQCRAYLRQELAREFREIVEGFVKGAKKGSCQHVKLAAELVGLLERPEKRKKGVVQELMEELQRPPD